MARYIIECDDPTDIVLGMRVIKELIKADWKDIIFQFDDPGGLWYGKKTKTGYSARRAR